MNLIWISTSASKNKNELRLTFCQENRGTKSMTSMLETRKHMCCLMDWRMTLNRKYWDSTNYQRPSEHCSSHWSKHHNEFGWFYRYHHDQVMEHKKWKHSFLHLRTEQCFQTCWKSCCHSDALMDTRKLSSFYVSWFHAINISQIKKNVWWSIYNISGKFQLDRNGFIEMSHHVESLKLSILC